MKVLYIKSSDSTFIKLDQKILEKHFKTYTFFINRKNKIYYIYSMIKLVIYLIINVFKFKVYFTRFADYHTAIIVFFAKLFNIYSIIVVGGYDVKHIPELKYGAYSNAVRSWCTKYSLKNATHLLPNNSTLILDTNTYSFKNPRNFGILQYAPDTKAKIKVIHNGFDINYWLFDDNHIEKNNKYVLTVAFVNNLRSYKIKGLEYYIKAAETLKNYTFFIIGFSQATANKLNIRSPNNLKLIGKISQDELKSYYYRSKIFCLFSLTEGMPNVLCEAMLCKCIPVGSNVNSIPELIDNTGFVVKNKNVDEIVRSIKMAINSDSKLGELARKRIVKNYSLERRENEIVTFIKNLNK